MRRCHPTLAAMLAVTVLPATLAAAPQGEPAEVRREVVVVSGHPSDHRVVLGQVASRAFLGVQLLNLTPELRRHFGARADSGVLVSRVEADSPAARAGVAVGDVITAVDGVALATSAQLVGRVRHRHEGDEIDLQVVRDRSSLTLRATLAETERSQVELGQFVWRSGEDGPLAIDLDPELIQRVITVDPETINESVSKLLQRLEAEGGMPSRPPLRDEQREELEKRIAELERRLLEMESQLRHRQRP